MAILDSRSGQNIVAGNYIGTDVTGTTALGNANYGVQVECAGNTIGGSTAGARNVIAGNGGSGVLIQGSAATGNVVAGNFIGTNAAGSAAIGNNIYGVFLQNGAHDNRIGTNGDGVADAAERNLISGNGFDGVNLYAAGTDGNVVAGNFLGTNAAGSAAVPNRRYGVSIAAGAHNNIIGTNGDGNGDAAERNVISGNGQTGVVIQDAGTDANVVAGNDIGTDATGTFALGNRNGVNIQGGARANRIGTDSDGMADGAERNVISGNVRVGVTIFQAGTSQNVVAGNFIGTDATGLVALGNLAGGVNIATTATENTIGGAAATARNVISGNVTYGVLINSTAGAGTSRNVVANNAIGTDLAGTASLGNTEQGIWVRDGASQNTIGGALGGNLIAHNGGAGISVTGALSTGNAILGNAIASNGGLGIDLGGDGVTPNDPSDGDSGPNNLQNTPVVEYAATNAAGTTIEVSLQSTPNVTFHVELFACPAADPSGSGEGAAFLAAFDITTDAAGYGSYTYTTATPVGVGQVITATATDPGANTSEFSAATAVAPAPDDVTAQVAFTFGGYYYNRRTRHFTQSVTITNTSTSAIVGPISLVLDDLSTGVTLVNATGTTRRTGTSTSPYIDILPAAGSLAPGQSVTILLEFDDPRLLSIFYTPRLLAGAGAR